MTTHRRDFSPYIGMGIKAGHAVGGALGPCSSILGDVEVDGVESLVVSAVQPGNIDRTEA
jgi:hypothetical protein